MCITSALSSVDCIGQIFKSVGQVARVTVLQGCNLVSASYQAFKAEVIHKVSDSQVVKGKAYITYPEGRLTLAEKPFDSVVVIGKRPG